ncbi:hypothetical protein BGZ95_011580 [Linnemannia exigua]|uniref:Uncharacterized protein n=1 Tax=Linnemannia exigua TaxID=604196 RepID=A0AAD4D9Q9_9FUNG|nr:hypothetical protein BGZ95_011580 [Linnemannia exigua]
MDDSRRWWRQRRQQRDNARGSYRDYTPEGDQDHMSEVYHDYTSEDQFQQDIMLDDSRRQEQRRRRDDARARYQDYTSKSHQSYISESNQCDMSDSNRSHKLDCNHIRTSDSNQSYALGSGQGDTSESDQGENYQDHTAQGYQDYTSERYEQEESYQNHSSEDLEQGETMNHQGYEMMVDDDNCGYNLENANEQAYPRTTHQCKMEYFESEGNDLLLLQRTNEPFVEDGDKFEKAKEEEEEDTLTVNTEDEMGVLDQQQRQHVCQIALVTTCFKDKSLDILFNRVARLHSQLPPRIVQEMVPYLLSDNIHNSLVSYGCFAQPQKTVSLLWKKWFTSELNRTSIWMLEVYFRDWKECAGLTGKQVEVYEIERRVVRSVLEKMCGAAMKEEELLQGRAGVETRWRPRGEGGGSGYGSGWRHVSIDVFRERVEDAKRAVEADVLREGSMRRYYDTLK